MVFEEYGTLYKLHFFNRIHKNFILHKLQYSYEPFKFILWKKMKIEWDDDIYWYLTLLILKHIRVNFKLIF